MISICAPSITLQVSMLWGVCSPMLLPGGGYILSQVNEGKDKM